MRLISYSDNLEDELKDPLFPIQCSNLQFAQPKEERGEELLGALSHRGEQLNLGCLVDELLDVVLPEAAVSRVVVKPRIMDNGFVLLTATTRTRRGRRE